MNGIKIQKSGPMFEGFRLSERFYFHNSFYLPLNKNTTSFANNGIAFTASLESGNFYGVQFLPDKSGEAGIKLLKNFLEL
jgi:glutamine amidotransferase